MSSVVIKFPRPLQRVEIIKRRDINLKEILGFFPPDIKSKKGKGDESSDPFFKSDSLFDKAIPKDVYSADFAVLYSKTPVTIDLEKLPKETITLSEAQSKIQTAYDQGFDNGKEVAANSLKHELEQHQAWVRSFDTIIKDFKIQSKKELKTFGESLTTLGIVVAEHILGHEISNNSNIVIEQIKKAIQSIDNEMIFKIYLNPSDIEILNSCKSTLTADSSRVENLELVPDEKVEQGTCILSTSAGIVDGRLKTQLDLVKELLDQAVSAIEEEEEIAGTPKPFENFEPSNPDHENADG